MQAEEGRKRERRVEGKRNEEINSYRRGGRWEEWRKEERPGERRKQ